LAASFHSGDPHLRLNKKLKWNPMKSWLVPLLFATALAGQPRNFRLPDEAAGVDAIAQALVSVFDQADIVALGEEHEWKPDSDVRIALVRHPDFAKKVRFIVVEFGRNSHQATLDRYIRGEDVPRAELERVWKTTQVGGGGSPIYPAFFAAVRDVNLKLPADARVRVFGAEGAPGLSGEATAVTFLKQQVLQKHGKALVVYGYSHFWRASPPEMLSRNGGVETGIVRMLEKDYPGRIVAVIPVGTPKRPSPPGSPREIGPDFRKFDRALKTPVRPVLLSLQRSPFRDFSAAEFLGGDVVVCGGTGDVPRQPKGNGSSKLEWARGPCVSVFQGSNLTLGQMADAVLYFGAAAGVVPKGNPGR
jgi:hypothetical protein